MLIYKLYKNQKSFQFKAIYQRSQTWSNFRNSRTTYKSTGRHYNLDPLATQVWGELLSRTGSTVILERTGTQRARVYACTHVAVMPREFLRFFVRFPRPGCVRWLARGARNTPLSSPHDIDVNPRPRNPVGLRPCHHFRHACCTRVFVEEYHPGPYSPRPPLFFIIRENDASPLTRDDSSQLMERSMNRGIVVSHEKHLDLLRNRFSLFNIFI